MKKILLAAAVTAAVSFAASCQNDAQPPFTPTTAPDEVSVLQVNIWQEGTVIPGGYNAIIDEIGRLKPDFVTLSEVRNYKDTRFCDRITQSLAEKGLTYYSFYSDDTGLLSRHPIQQSATVFPYGDDHGSIYKLIADVDGRRFAVYTAHLDYLDDTYYEVRGYDGNDWHRIDPVTDVATLLERNARSQRDEAIAAFLADAAREVEAGSIVILGGDFNEPSHLDWTEATAQLADHHGVVIEWPNTKALEQAGFVDAYRQVFADPVKYPGYTYPSFNPDREPKRVTWAPEADERDRIDYIFYHPGAGGNVTATRAWILGPSASIAYGKRVDEAGQDPFLQPLGVWPTDHKGVFVTLRYK